jgi:cobalt-zinc-cadmium efflux system outer membrane protein
LPPDTAVGSAQLEVLTAEQARAEAELAAARRLSLPVTVGVGRKRVRLGEATDHAVVLEVDVGIPLFDRQQGERARASAALSLAESRREREETTLQVTRSAFRAQAEARIAAAERLATKLRPEAEALGVIAKASFAEGELEVFALLDALESHTHLAEQSTEEALRALEAVFALEALMPVQP